MQGCRPALCCCVAVGGVHYFCVCFCAGSVVGVVDVGGEVAGAEVYGVVGVAVATHVEVIVFKSGGCDEEEGMVGMILLDVFAEASRFRGEWRVACGGWLPLAYGACYSFWASCQLLMICCK